MKAVSRRASIVGATILLLMACLQITAGHALGLEKETATLRNFKQGDELPSFKLPRIMEPAPQVFTPADGKPTAILFFSIRPDFRKKRSLALLSTMAELESKYKGRITVVGVYSDDREDEAVAAYMNGASIRLRVYLDPLKDVHNRYGVFMMPLVVMTDGKGKLHEVIPYTFDIREIVEGNIRLLLGEWTKEQLQASLAPKENVIRSDAEKEHIRRINYGRIMHSKQMYAQAVREFSTAVKLMPQSIDGHLALGFTYLAMEKWDLAETSFQEALRLDPESDDAVAGLGLSYYGRRDIERALEHLENAFISPNPRLEVIIALAEIHETRGDNVKANRLNKLAVSRLMTLYDQRWK